MLAIKLIVSLYIMSVEETGSLRNISHLRKIGNSQGVIIPASFLEACSLKKAIDLRVEGNTLIIEAQKNLEPDGLIIIKMKSAIKFGMAPYRMILPRNGNGKAWRSLLGKSCPTFGSEIKQTRPALIVSPNNLNSALPRVIIAPLLHFPF